LFAFKALFTVGCAGIDCIALPCSLCLVNRGADNVLIGGWQGWIQTVFLLGMVVYLRAVAFLARISRGRSAGAGEPCWRDDCAVSDVSSGFAFAGGTAVC
jgi:hypothetical protein